MAQRQRTDDGHVRGRETFGHISICTSYVTLHSRALATRGLRSWPDTTIPNARFTAGCGASGCPFENHSASTASDPASHPKIRRSRISNQAVVLAPVDPIHRLGGNELERRIMSHAIGKQHQVVASPSGRRCNEPVAAQEFHGRSDLLRSGQIHTLVVSLRNAE